MKLLIGADIVPTINNQEYFINGEIAKLVDKELKMVLDTADYRIFNLEVPLTNSETPISKCGPNLIAPTATVNGIKSIGTDFLTLANNHILDQGEQGLHSTIDALDKARIAHAGTGNCPKDAAKPHIIEKDGKKIGIYCCAEHEFSIVTNHSAGVNPFDPLESLDHIAALKNECDYVIVLYHGGKEHYRYPSPNLQKSCRKMIQKGADLIICQHSHCVGCYEEYEESTIVYGQGNFIFNKHDNDLWNNGLLIKVTIIDNIQIDYVPIVKEGNSIILATGIVAEEILSGFDNRSKEIIDEGFIEKRYKEFAEKNIENYLRAFSSMGKWLSRIDRRLFKGKILKQMYNKKQLLAIQNIIECEAHQELVRAGLKGATASERK